MTKASQSTKPTKTSSKILADWKVEQKDRVRVEQEAKAQWEEQRQEVVSTLQPQRR
jgi:hypothetical protein